MIYSTSYIKTNSLLSKEIFDELNYELKGHEKLHNFYFDVYLRPLFIMKLYMIYDSKGHIKSQKVTRRNLYHTQKLIRNGKIKLINKRHLQ